MEHADEIIKNLWLGNRNAPLEHDNLKKNNIKLIINCTKDINYPADNDVHVIRLDIHDINSEESNRILKKDIDKLLFLINLYLNNDIGVLVHCWAGVQRSATVVLCYLLKYKHMGLHMGKALMKSKRSIVFFPQPTFDNFINDFSLNT